MTLYQDCSSHLDLSENLAARGRGSFSLYIYIESLKNLLFRNHWTNCYIILQKYSFSDSVPRLFKPFGFVKKHGRQGRGLFSLYIYIENLKNLLVRNHWTDFHILLQKCSFDLSKRHGRQGVGLIFPIYLYRKLEKSSCQKPLDQFHYSLAKMFPWSPCTKIIQDIVIRQKHGC